MAISYNDSRKLTQHLRVQGSWAGRSSSENVQTLQTHGLPQARLPCPSPPPRVCSNPCQWSRCYLTTSSSVVPFSCPQSASGSFSVRVGSSHQVAKLLVFGVIKFHLMAGNATGVKRPDTTRRGSALACLQASLGRPHAHQNRHTINNQNWCDCFVLGELYCFSFTFCCFYASFQEHDFL